MRAARPVSTLEEDARAGLLAKPRSLPPKYFYDDHGSHLFDRLCETPEYYPTRVETALLQAHAERIIERTRPAHIVEFGSGMPKKIRVLLDACARLGHRCAYHPIDICRGVLEVAARELERDYPWLEVRPVLGDYHAGLDHLALPGDGRRLALFLGSTIGNFTEPEALCFMHDVRRTLRAGDALLLGVDRVKSRAVLAAAYDDATGLTARFNINLLRVLNRELDANFSPDGFTHHAFYNERKRRVEMHLVAKTAQEVAIPALRDTLRFERGETIRTELSRKFTGETLAQLIASTGYAFEAHYTPADEYFSLALARREEPPAARP